MNSTTKEIFSIWSIMIAFLFYSTVCYPQKGLLYSDLCKYSTKISPKAKGLNLSLRVPCRWELRESDRPNIALQFYGSPDEDSNIEVGANLVIVKAPRLITEKEIEEQISYANLKKVASEKGKFISARVTTIDGIKAGEVIYERGMDFPAAFVNANVLQYIVIWRDYMLILTYFAGSEDRERSKYLFNKHLRAFKISATSLVLLSKR